MKRTAVNIWRFLFGRFSKYDVRAYFVAYHLVKLFIMFFISPPFLLPTFLNTPVVGDDKEAMSVMSLSIGVWATKHGDTEFISLPL